MNSTDSTKKISIVVSYFVIYNEPSKHFGPIEASNRSNGLGWKDISYIPYSTTMNYRYMVLMRAEECGGDQHLLFQLEFRDLALKLGNVFKWVRIGSTLVTQIVCVAITPTKLVLFLMR
jgi:hypothetical protein